MLCCVVCQVHLEGLFQSRNRGHQNAVLAGLMEAKDKCDITISIDCDGQDDINAMNEMDERAVEAVKAAINKAKICKKPIAGYDKEKKRAYVEYANGERKYAE